MVVSCRVSYVTVVGRCEMMIFGRFVAGKLCNGRGSAQNVEFMVGCALIWASLPPCGGGLPPRIGIESPPPSVHGGWLRPATPRLHYAMANAALAGVYTATQTQFGPRSCVHSDLISQSLHGKGRLPFGHAVSYTVVWGRREYGSAQLRVVHYMPICNGDDGGSEPESADAAVRRRRGCHTVEDKSQLQGTATARLLGRRYLEHMVPHAIAIPGASIAAPSSVPSENGSPRG